MGGWMRFWVDRGWWKGEGGDVGAVGRGGMGNLWLRDEFCI